MSQGVQRPNRQPSPLWQSASAAQPGSPSERQALPAPQKPETHIWPLPQTASDAQVPPPSPAGVQKPKRQKSPLAHSVPRKSAPLVRASQWPTMQTWSSGQPGAQSAAGSMMVQLPAMQASHGSHTSPGAPSATRLPRLPGPHEAGSPTAAHACPTQRLPLAQPPSQGPAEDEVVELSEVDVPPLVLEVDAVVAEPPEEDGVGVPPKEELGVPPE